MNRRAFESDPQGRARLDAFVQRLAELG